MVDLTAPATAPTGSASPSVGASGPGRQFGDYTWGLVSAVFLVAFLPLLLVKLTPAVPRAQPLLWLWPLGVTAVSGLGYAQMIGRGRRSLFAMTFWMFSYLFMGLAPMVQLRTGVTPETTSDLDPALLLPAALVVMLGVLAWAAGSWIAGRSADRGSAAPAAVSTPRSERSFELRAYLLSAFTLLSAAYYFARLGPAALFSNRVDLEIAKTAIWPDPSIAALITGICTASLLVPIAAMRQILAARRNRGRPIAGVTLLTGVLMVALLVNVNPISSSRYLFGTVALALAVIFGAVGSTFRFRVFAISILVLMLLVFPYADVFRYQPGQPRFDKGGAVQALTSPDYDAFSQVTNTLAYTETHGVTWGRQALGVTLFWVPRRFWPDKPEDTGITLAKDRGYSFTNLSAPLWAEFFINGGWWAVAGGMGLLGWGSRRADRRSGDFGTPLTPLTAILPFYMIILLRGSLLQAMATLAIFLGSAVYLRGLRPNQDGTHPATWPA
jgi:hypothetical protein